MEQQVSSSERLVDTDETSSMDSDGAGSRHEEVGSQSTAVLLLAFPSLMSIVYYVACWRKRSMFTEHLRSIVDLGNQQQRGPCLHCYLQELSASLLAMDKIHNSLPGQLPSVLPPSEIKEIWDRTRVSAM